jgi:hypothetical protein
VTVTIWKLDQLLVVNVNAAGETVAVATAALVGVIVTVAAGGLSSLMLYAVAPPTGAEIVVSFTVTPGVSLFLTVTPGVSLSLTVNVTPVTTNLGEVVADKITVSSASLTESSTIDTVPVAEFSPTPIVKAAGSE